MRQDIIIGVAISALIHAGIFIGSFGPHKRPPHIVAPKVVQDVLEMTKYEPDEEPQKVESPDVDSKPVEVAPPSQVDVPQPTVETDITQRVQPPRPDGIPVDSTISVIPANRNPIGPGTRILDLKDLDQQPVARVRTAPQYPFEMKHENMTGRVVVDFVVDAQGAVQNAYALSSTDRGFEEAAVQAVRKWKFKPGVKGGRPVNTHMQIPIVFDLNGD
jgi:protein TonB